MGYWENFNQTALPKKEEIYSSLNTEFITDVNYVHAKKLFKDFEINNLVEHHEINFKRNKLLLADAFKIFREISLKIYHLHLKFLSAPELAWQTALKNTEVKLELLTCY